MAKGVRLRHPKGVRGVTSKNKKRQYALISVFDKTGIVELAKTLHALGYRMISTGGTAKVLTENKIPVVSIQNITGNPESFDGRMKTISFQVESGILFDRKNRKHVQEAKDLGIKPIDIVICNLYPFEQTITKPKITQDEAIENIDVGGPTMVRAAAKNFKHVLVVVDPTDYHSITDAIRKKQDTLSFRQKLAAKAFAYLSFYDAQIAQYFGREPFPNEISLPLRKALSLRYGENPHQKAAVYFYPNTNSPLQHLQKAWGRDLSHVNITDINAGLESVRLFEEPCAVIIKHNCPCGIALGKTIAEALQRAILADPESAFGGIIVLNKPMDIHAAKEIEKFKDEKKANIDIVAVPKIAKNALDFLRKVRKSMGIYTFARIPKKSNDRRNIKWIDGGLVLQTPDDTIEQSFKEWKVVTKRIPTKQQLLQMRIAWKFISRIKSNAIIVVDKTLPMTRGIGTGQTSRVRSTKIALSQAGVFTKNGILASDSFFPFDDSVQLAADAGISAIIQQGGSINDKLSIEAAEKAGISMVFTYRRAFWH